MNWHERMGRRARRRQQETWAVLCYEIDWALHALYCERCDIRNLVLWLLDVAGRTEDDLFEVAWQRLSEAVSGGGR